MFNLLGKVCSFEGFLVVYRIILELFCGIEIVWWYFGYYGCFFGFWIKVKVFWIGLNVSVIVGNVDG